MHIQSTFNVKVIDAAETIAVPKLGCTQFIIILALFLSQRKEKEINLFKLKMLTLNTLILILILIMRGIYFQSFSLNSSNLRQIPIKKTFLHIKACRRFIFFSSQNMLRRDHFILKMIFCRIHILLNSIQLFNFLRSCDNLQSKQF